MIRPILTEDIFELNDQIQTTFDGEVIIVNNIFKHYNEILKYINYVTIEPWKLDPNVGILKIIMIVVIILIEDY